MGKLRFLVISISVIVLLLGWIDIVSTPSEHDVNEQMFSEACKLADEYTQKGLYELAISEYEKALSCKEELDVRKRMLTAYEKMKEDGNINNDYDSSYKAVLKETYKIYPEDEQIFDKLIDALENSEEYEEACMYLQRRVGSGTDDNALKNKLNSVKYMVRQVQISEGLAYKGKAFDHDIFASENSFISFDSEAQHETVKDNDVSFLKYVSENGMILYRGKDETLLADSNGVLLMRMNSTIEDATCFSEDAIAIKNEGKYRFYSLHGDLLEGFDSYDSAGCFQNGLVPVKKDNRWLFINREGKVEKETDFSDVVLDYVGHYLFDDIFIAKQGSKYNLYNSDFNKVSDFEADSLDCSGVDGVYAFENNGKSGFVDKTGSIVKVTDFQQCKSFSNGLAAVKKGDKWGFVNSDYELVIECQYDDAYYFNKNGFCVVGNLIDESSVNTDEPGNEKTMAYSYIKRVVNIK